MNVSELSQRDLAGAHRTRFARVRDEMQAQGVEALVLSLGADLPWLTGYQAMPLERLTALVVFVDSDPMLVVPALEAPRVEVHWEPMKIRSWHDWEDPHEIVAGAIAGARTVGVSDRMWSVSLLKLLSRSSAGFVPASAVTGRLRSVKDPLETALLAEAGRRTDVVAQALLDGEIKLIGRSEREISMELGERLLAEGLHRVNFAIVGSGPNSSSPHHEPGGRIVGADEAVVCDFGGEFKMAGCAPYCSDITRTVVTGEMPERFRELYSILESAQRRQREATAPGLSCESLDRLGRDFISDHGYGEYFIHRTGHGIGVEEHEEPYIVEGNEQRIEDGNAFSIEPGIYIPSLYGARIEDILIATPQGCRLLNDVDRGLRRVG